VKADGERVRLAVEGNGRRELRDISVGDDSHRHGRGILDGSDEILEGDREFSGIGIDFFRLAESEHFRRATRIPCRICGEIGDRLVGDIIEHDAGEHGICKKRKHRGIIRARSPGSHHGGEFFGAEQDVHFPFARQVGQGETAIGVGGGDARKGNSVASVHFRPPVLNADAHAGDRTGSHINHLGAIGKAGLKCNRQRRAVRAEVNVDQLRSISVSDDLEPLVARGNAGGSEMAGGIGARAGVVFDGLAVYVVAVEMAGEDQSIGDGSAGGGVSNGAGDGEAALHDDDRGAGFECVGGGGGLVAIELEADEIAGGQPHFDALGIGREEMREAPVGIGHGFAGAVNHVILGEREIDLDVGNRVILLIDDAAGVTDTLEGGGRGYAGARAKE
jgi:hypothetical protein